MLPTWSKCKRCEIAAILVLISCTPRVPTIQIGASVTVTTASEKRPPVEAHLAIHPNDPQHLLGAAMTSVVAEDQQEMMSGTTCSSFVSRDGGQTWESHEFPVTACLDPWVTIMPSSRAVLTAFAARGELSLFHSDDAGITWNEQSVSLGELHDHPTTVADRSSPDRLGWLYVLSNRYVRGENGALTRALHVARSKDAGETFDPPVHVRPTDSDPSAEVPVVLSDGSLVVTFTEARDAQGADLRERRAWAIRSTDGGLTFADPALVNDVCGPPYRLSLLAADASGGPFQDRLYFACNLQGPSGVVISHSGTGTDGWSDAVQVHSAPVDTAIRRKIMALAVNRRGVVGAAWVDARHAPPGADCYDVYFSASLDGGQSFLPEQRVTESTSCPDESVDGLIARVWAVSGGDYIGMATDGNGWFRQLWSDARDGAFHLRTTWVTVDGQVKVPN